MTGRICAVCYSSSITMYNQANNTNTKANIKLGARIFNTPGNPGHSVSIVTAQGKQIAITNVMNNMNFITSMSRVHPFPVPF